MGERLLSERRILVSRHGGCCGTRRSLRASACVRRRSPMFLSGPRKEIATLESCASDHTPKHAVALAVQIQLAARVDGESDIGAAAEHEIRSRGETRHLAAARMIGGFDDRKHRVV